jgi:hypothetical protein
MILASPAASQVVPGVLGFIVVAGMGFALFFLLRSMNKQLRKVVPGPAWKEKAGPGAQAGQRDSAQKNGSSAP